MLYPQQQIIVDQLKAGLQNPSPLINHHLYITGEPGVGKTYMASALAQQLNAQHILIISPATVTSKWQKVFQQYNPNLPLPTIAKPRRQTYQDDLNNTTIVTHRDLTDYLLNHFQTLMAKYNYTKEQQTNILDNISLYYNSANSKARKTDECPQLTNTAQNALDFNDPDYQPLFDFDLVIVDEIHAIKSTTKTFASLAMLNAVPNLNMLGLTGTLFNQNLEYLQNLLLNTHPQLLSNFGMSFDRNAFNNSAIFYDQIGQYICAQISLKDVEQVQNKPQDDIKQKIMPLNGIQMSDEQAAWYQLTEANMQYILHKTKKATDKVLTQQLDFPAAPIKPFKTHHALDSNSNQLVLNYPTVTLTPIRITATVKFKQLENILQTTHNKTLIFVEDRRLIKELAENLPNAGYLKAGLKKNQYAEFINDQLTNHVEQFIVTTNQISVGVDITSATQIIWYQVPNDVAKIIQAQRRIYRLNSQQSSKIYYLFYKNTEQEDIINQVSSASIKNAATYNTRQDDQLAKITKILFPEL